MFELTVFGSSMGLLASCAALLLVYPLQIILILTICEDYEPDKEQSEYEMQAGLLPGLGDIACEDAESFESAENMPTPWRPLTASFLNTLKELRSKGFMGLYRAFGIQVLYSMIYETTLWVLRRPANPAHVSMPVGLGPASTSENAALLAMSMLLRICLLPLDVLTTWQVVNTTASRSFTSVLAILTSSERRMIRNLLGTHLLVIVLPGILNIVFMLSLWTSSIYAILFSLVYQLFGFILIVLPLQHLAYSAHLDMVDDHLQDSIVSLGRRHESCVERLKHFYSHQNSFSWYKRSRQVFYLLAISWLATIAISILLMWLRSLDSVQF